MLLVLCFKKEIRQFTSGDKNAYYSWTFRLLHGGPKTWVNFSLFHLLTDQDWSRFTILCHLSPKAVYKFQLGSKEGFAE